MKQYKNIKTGAVIDSSFIIRGKNWVEVSKLEEIKEKQETETNVDIEDEFEEIDLSQLKKPELVKFAKEHGITIDEKSKKEVIIEDIVKVLG